MAERVISPLEKRALEYLRVELRPDLAAHSVATRDFALEVNRTQSLGLDEEKIALGALCHDLARLFTPRQMEDGLRARGIDPDSFGFVIPMLLHGPLSAEIARDEIGVDDQEVLHAIRIHATGSGEMSLLDKLIYVADKVEPGRDYEGVEELRHLASKDVRVAFPEVMAWVLAFLVAHKQPLDYNSVAAYNHALADAEEHAGGG